MRCHRICPTLMLLLGVCGAVAVAAPGHAETTVEVLEQVNSQAEPETPDLHKKILEEEKAPPGARIVGGRRLPNGFFRDAVVIFRGSGSERRLCSGVLVAPDVVLTAGHCVCDMNLANPGLATDADSARVYMGDESLDTAVSATVHVAGALLYDATFCSDSKGKIDVALVRLDMAQASSRFAVRPPGPAWFEDPKAVAPVRIAPTYLYLLRNVTALTIVGYGEDDRQNYGLKRYARVQIASRICGRASARRLFGCLSGKEIVLAGYMGQDTCRGDSGGPAYAVMGTDYYLVAVTSRAIDPWARCGLGGVYTLITPAIVNWLRGRGVAVHAFQ